MTLRGAALLGCGPGLWADSVSPWPVDDEQATTPSSLLTGTQHELTFEDQRLVVTQIGAGIRLYQRAGLDVVDGFPETSGPSGARGVLLAPWPGRIEAGRYTFDGVTHQLPVGPNASVAMHGLVRSVDWQVVETSGSSITLQHLLGPQEGYPFQIELQLGYEVGTAGMAVRSTARNVGSRAAPYGIGWHPYFTVGTATIDGNMLQVPATVYIPRENGVSTPPAASVAGSQWDFRFERSIGSEVFADACNYGELLRDADGMARVTLREGTRQVIVWMDRTIDYITVYTGNDRRSLAIEPCTCPSGAFNTGIGLIRLLPGERFECRWGVSAVRS